MTSLPLPMRPNYALNSSGAWKYWRPPASGIVELGTVRGLDVALPAAPSSVLAGRLEPRAGCRASCWHLLTIPSMAKPAEDST
jgi:hypothetical protein